MELPTFFWTNEEINIELNVDDCDDIEISKISFDIDCPDCEKLAPCRPEDNNRDFDNDCDPKKRTTERVRPYMIYGDSPRSGFVNGRWSSIGVYTVEWYINGDRDNVESIDFQIIEP